MIIGAEIHAPHALFTIETRIADLDPLGLGALHAIQEVAGNRLFRKDLEISVHRYPEVGEHLVESKAFGLRLKHWAVV